MISLMKNIISFIVPVYNVDRYVEKCVESLLSQGLSEDSYEIILVDDGSTDRSGILCDRLAETHSVIKVIHQCNKGLSEARNAGMRIATGEFIQFVDSDDYLERWVVPELLKAMNDKNLDILRFQVRNVYEQRESSAPINTFSSTETNHIMDGSQYLQDYMGYACYVWQFLFRSSFLLNNCLFFKPGIIFEDAEWIPRVMVLAERVSAINLLVYDYFEREGSITKSIVEKKVYGQLLLVGEMEKQKSGFEEKNWHLGMIASLVVSIITTVAVAMYTRRKEILDQLKGMGVFPLSTYHSNKKGRIKIFLINISPSLACRMIHLLNS